jgi:hypothetical protein
MAKKMVGAFQVSTSILNWLRNRSLEIANRFKRRNFRPSD